MHVREVTHGSPWRKAVQVCGRGFQARGTSTHRCGALQGSCEWALFCSLMTWMSGLAHGQGRKSTRPLRQQLITAAFLVPRGARPSGPFRRDRALGEHAWPVGAWNGSWVALLAPLRRLPVALCGHGANDRCYLCKEVPIKSLPYSASLRSRPDMSVLSGRTHTRYERPQKSSHPEYCIPLFLRNHALLGPT